MSDKKPLRLYAVFSPTALKAMKGIRGKLAAQAGHAYLHAWWDAFDRHPETALAYRSGPRAFKIALVAPDDADAAWFESLAATYRPLCGVTTVVDAGFTVFEGPTLTCVGIGPISPDDCESTLNGLRLLT